MYGRGSTAPVKGAELPKVAPTEAWDGQDGVVSFLWHSVVELLI